MSKTKDRLLKEIESDKINGIHKQINRFKKVLRNFFSNLFMDVLLTNQQQQQQQPQQDVNEIVLNKKNMMPQQKILRTYDELLRERGYKLGRTLGSGSYAKVKYVLTFLNYLQFRRLKY